LLLADKRLAHRYEPPKEILSGIPQSLDGIEVYDADYRGLVWRCRASAFTKHACATAASPAIREALGRTDCTGGFNGLGGCRRSSQQRNDEQYVRGVAGKPTAGTAGWQVITEVAGNARKFDRISSTTAKDVTLGETAYAFAIDFYAFAQIACRRPLEHDLRVARGFTAISPDGIAILKGAPNLVLAQRFIDFVLAEDGQKLWLLPKGHPEDRSNTPSSECPCGRPFTNATRA